jgi:hypothetical protein
MAISTVDSPLAIAKALAVALNASRREPTFVGTKFHADVTSTTSGDVNNLVATPLAVVAPAATNLATLLTLCGELKIKVRDHLADALAHKVADTANTTAAATPTDLATAQTFLNELKADYNTHIASTTYHYTADAANGIAAADATDLASAQTLANEIRTDFFVHVASAPAGNSIKLL